MAFRKQTSVELLVNPFWPFAYHSLSSLAKAGRLWPKSRHLGLKTRIWTCLWVPLCQQCWEPCKVHPPSSPALGTAPRWGCSTACERALINDTESQKAPMNASPIISTAEKWLTRQQHWDHSLEALRPIFPPKNHEAAKFIQVRHTLVGLKRIQGAHVLLKTAGFFFFYFKTLHLKTPYDRKHLCTLQCFWYNTVFHTSISFSAKKFALSDKQPNSHWQRIQLRHIVSAKWKTKGCKNG